MSTTTRLIILAAVVGGGFLLYQQQQLKGQQQLIQAQGLTDDLMYELFRSDFDKKIDRKTTEAVAQMEKNIEAEKKRVNDWNKSHEDYIWRVNTAWAKSVQTGENFDELVDKMLKIPIKQLRGY